MTPLLAPSEKDVPSSNYLLVDGPQGTSPRIDADEKDVVQSPSPRWSSRPSKHRLVGFLPTIIVMAITLGFVALMLGFILGTYYVPKGEKPGLGAALARGHFSLDEEIWTRHRLRSSSSKGHLGLLILSSLASHLITDTSSILMTLIAYRVGAQWLTASQENGSIAQRPTPLQYGLMVRLMGSSSISAIGESCMYAARPQTRSRLPRLFKQALIMSVCVWVLARMVGLADFWLHLTSKSVSATKTSPAKSYEEYNFSARFNDTICPAHEAEIVDYGWGDSLPGPYPCAAAFEEFVFKNEPMTTAGFYTMANNSISPWSVITLADAADLAILVSTPSIDTQNKSYTVSTVGIQADCVSLNSLCKHDPEDGPMVTDCRNVGYLLPYFNNRTSPDEVASESTQIEDYTFGIVNEQLLPTRYANIDSSPSRTMTIIEITSDWDLGNMSYVTSNPAKMAVQLRWDPRNLAYTTNLHGTVYDPPLDDRAVDASTLLKLTLYAGCNVTFFNVTARLDGEQNTWTLIDRTPSSNEFATTLWLPTMMQQVTEHLAGALLAPARSQKKGAVMAAMNQHLARLMLGAASGYFEPAEATEVDHLAETLLGQYSFGPVIFFILLLCLYALLALLVFMSSWWTVDQAIVAPDGESTDTEGTSMLALTQTWLISPIPLVGGVFPGEDKRDEQGGVRFAGERDGGVVYDGSISDVRLGVGLTRDGFGIWKRPVGHKVMEVDEP